jgi:hypothetical protein
MRTKKQFHWFWAWEDEKEEAWLRSMAQQGWHFKSVSAPGNYTFEEGPAADYVYRLDYFTDRKDRANYLQLFEDAGWAHLGEMNGWQYFRQKAVDGRLPEIYTDNASKAQKYQRIMLLLVILLPLLLNAVVLVGRGATNGLIQAVSLLLGALLLLYVYALVRLLQRIGQLRRRGIGGRL